jgi:hypothetical protein
MTWPCDGRQTHVSRVVSFWWLQRFGSHNFEDWFIVVSFVVHSYYNDGEYSSIYFYQKENNVLSHMVRHQSSFGIKF